MKCAYETQASSKVHRLRNAVAQCNADKRKVGRMIGGKRCTGRNGNALQMTDWAECSECGGTGGTEKNNCEACFGAGWVYVRK